MAPDFCSPGRLSARSGHPGRSSATAAVAAVLPTKAYLSVSSSSSRFCALSCSTLTAVRAHDHISSQRTGFIAITSGASHHPKLVFVADDEPVKLAWAWLFGNFLEQPLPPYLLLLLLASWLLIYRHHLSSPTHTTRVRRCEVQERA